MLINELFYSIQGEGELCGVPSVFVRTSGCNLRCDWCDSPTTSWRPQGENRQIDELIAQVGSYQAVHCVLTGGEPMIAPGIHDLALRLKNNGYHVTIETAGTLPPESIACDLASISPKMSNSQPGSSIGMAWQVRHQKTRINHQALRSWLKDYDVQLKFVIASRSDVDELIEFLDELPAVAPHKVLLMPEGTDAEVLASRRSLVSAACLSHGFRYCHRLHIDLFGHAPGT